MLTLNHLTGFGAFTPASAPPASYITSIQTFDITIATGSTNNTATITSVDTTKSVIFWGGYSTNHASTTQREYRPRVELTNATTVTAYRDSSSASYTTTVKGTVVEFASAAVDSVQHGSITVASGSASGTATISSVNTSRAVVFFLGNTNNTTNTSPANMEVALDLTNSTTVTATRATTGTAILEVGYIVVEFSASVIASVQQRSVTLTSATTGSTDTISSVNTGNTMLIHAGVYCNSSTHSVFYYNLELTGATTVTLTRTGTSTTSRTIKYTVVEFASGVLASSVQRGTTAVSGVTSADSSITSVNTSKAVCNWLHFSTNASSALQIFATAKLLNATTVRSEKNTATNTSTNGWEVIEFT